MYKIFEIDWEQSPVDYMGNGRDPHMTSYFYAKNCEEAIDKLEKESNANYYNEDCIQRMYAPNELDFLTKFVNTLKSKIHLKENLILKKDFGSDINNLIIEYFNDVEDIKVRYNLGSFIWGF